MKGFDNMNMYDNISEYYDEIFPIDAATLDFIRRTVGDPPKSVLDVACGSGGYAVEMSKYGYDVTATDNSPDMILRTSQKAREGNVSLDVVECDMRNIESKIQKKFDCIYCIGNSIVHITDIDEITDVVMQMGKLLVQRGTLIIQTLNYDRIIRLNITRLPVIENKEKGITFVRTYDLDNHDGTVKFRTEIIIDNKRVNASVKGEVDLYPIKKDEMIQVLKKAGFNNIQIYGDFTGQPYNEDSIMLIIKAKK